ncbi:MAG TPA: hypothetical protein VJT49_08010 [Amycolatopsis sp.]|uniref:hypothetical protein n=1 Tax=Amycolatopsis sp. TaxID=37632 RepID=UPI002B4641F2|nr:hypothetical protein [Amycolatopsis sp.]HKS45051.1 hypothetical protein [Amycolatopsis sp.]
MFSLEIVYPADPDFAAAEEVEAKIFRNAYGLSPELMADELAPYRDASEFLVLRDSVTGRIAGEVRLVTNSPAGFKSLNDMGHDPWSTDYRTVLRENGLTMAPEYTVDIATLGVDEGYLFKDDPEMSIWVRIALFHGICQYSVERGTRHWVAILDNRVLALIQRIGKPFQKYHGVDSAEYLGSPCTPVWSDFTAATENLRKDQPVRYAQVVCGKGLDRVVDLPPKGALGVRS